MNPCAPSGPVVTGLIGTKLPKFSVFGDTMNTASRLESTCVPGEGGGGEVRSCQVREVGGRSGAPACQVRVVGGRSGAAR